MKRILLLGCLFVAATLYAAQPSANIGAKHPNLSAAQDLISQAYERVMDAQRANEFDMGGHAQKVKNLLDQASKELKLAAVDANQTPGSNKKPNSGKHGAAMDEKGRNVSDAKHPNLAAAQDLISQAYVRIGDAQKANEFDLGGHAGKAKDLLEQANQELKMAAVKTNQ